MRRHSRPLTAASCLAVLGILVLTSACNRAPDVEAPARDLREATIADLRSAMAAGDVSAVEITEYYLARIEALDSGLNAILEVNPDAIEIARALDRERAAGRVRSALHGIPVVIKDNIDTADRMHTTAGSLALADAPPPAADAALVAQLRDAGAVLLGKANLTEWANFRAARFSSGWSARGGQTRNPYALDRTPCGSSAGSAVAVAANLVAVAIGTETDGSIVCPAGNSGIVGIKPTVGLVSQAGIIPIARSFDTAGPMARTVADAAVLLGAIIDREAVTDRSPPLPADYTRFLSLDALAGKRIGVLRQLLPTGTDITLLMESQFALLQAAGATVTDVDLPGLGQIRGPAFQVMLFEFKVGINDYLASRGAQIDSLEDLIAFNQQTAAELLYFGQDLFTLAQSTGGLDNEAYMSARERVWTLARAQGIDAAVAGHDLDALVAPTNGTAWLIDLANGDRPGAAYVSSSTLAAAAGYPSITVPAGFVGPLPIGISFIGPAYSEPVLIAIAYAYEQRSQARQPPGTQGISAQVQRVGRAMDGVVQILPGSAGNR